MRATVGTLFAVVSLVACVPPLPGGSLAETPDGSAVGTSGGGATGGGGTGGTGGSSMPDYVFVASAGSPVNLALDAKYVYWVDASKGGVMRIPLEGGTPTLVSTTSVKPNSCIRVDGSGIYWGTGTGQYATEIVRTGLDGGPKTTLVPDSGLVNRFAVNGGWIYWVNMAAGTLSKISTNGGAPIPLASRVSPPVNIVADADNVYWEPDTPGDIMKVGTSGGTPVTLVTGAGAFDLALDAKYVYWAGNGAVNRVPIDGGDVELVYTPPGAARSVAVDASGVYWSDASGAVLALESPTSARVLASFFPGCVPFGMTLGPSSVYWLCAGTIFKAPK